MKESKKIFSKLAHIDIIEQIAVGMKRAGMADRYLELGIAKSRCFNRVARHFRFCIGVDINDFFKYVTKEIVTNRFTQHIGTTDSFFDTFNEKCDMIFIDANHEYENALRDLKNSLRVIKDNGLILLHDTYPPEEQYIGHCKGAYKIVEYLKQNIELHGIEFVTLPFYYGITIVRKYSEKPLWLKNE